MEIIITYLNVSGQLSTAKPPGAVVAPKEVINVNPKALKNSYFQKGLVKWKKDLQVRSYSVVSFSIYNLKTSPFAVRRSYLDNQGIDPNFGGTVTTC